MGLVALIAFNGDRKLAGLPEQVGSRHGHAIMREPSSSIAHTYCECDQRSCAHSNGRKGATHGTFSKISWQGGSTVRRQHDFVRCHKSSLLLRSHREFLGYVC